MTEYQIVVIDPKAPGNWSAKKLIAVGVPLKVARRWQKVRYEMTTGLKKRVAQAVN